MYAAKRVISPPNRIEIILRPANLKLDDRHQFDTTFPVLDAARLARTSPVSDLLAVELDLERHAHSLPLLSTLARVYPDCRWLGSGTDRLFTLDALTARFCFAFCRVFSGVVDFRDDQFPHFELGISWQQYLYPIGILCFVHDFVFHCDAGSFRDSRISAEFSMVG